MKWWKWKFSNIVFIFAYNMPSQSLFMIWPQCSKNSTKKVLLMGFYSASYTFYFLWFEKKGCSWLILRLSLYSPFWPLFFHVCVINIVNIFVNIHFKFTRVTFTSSINGQEISRNSKAKWKLPEDSRHKLSKEIEIQLITKNDWGRRKENVFKKRNWLIHHVEVIFIMLLKNISHKKTDILVLLSMMKYWSTISLFSNRQMNWI